MVGSDAMVYGFWAKYCIVYMDPKKSEDMDDISSDLLKSIDTSIAKPLAHFFNLSLKTGTFPSTVN